MSNGTPADPGSHEAAGAGSSTDQHVTGADETGEFITDEEPTGGTPVHGSSNAGINQAGGKPRVGDERDAAEGRS